MSNAKATREQNKTHNTRLILQTIYNHTAISRVAIARATHLTPTAVSNKVAELIEEGLIEEIGQAPSVGGKPPMLLSIVPDARHLLCLDLTQEAFRGAVINLRGQVHHQLDIPLNGKTGPAAVAVAAELVERLLAATDRPALGIGVGAAGLIDTDQGVVRQAVNLGWHDLPLGSLLGQRFGLPVYVVNDSKAAAIAEATFGSGRGRANLAVVRVGQGIGMGLILNNRLFFGDGGGAGEIGHVMVAEGGLACRCGSFGCLETVASSQAIVAQVQTLALHQPGAPLHAQAASRGLDLEAVLAAHAADDPLVAPIVANAGGHLGAALAHLVGALNLHHIIIAGVAARFGAGLLGPLCAQLQRRVLPSLAEQTQVELSTLGDPIVTLGAAAMLLSHELGLS